jgi:hypothetical protein
MRRHPRAEVWRTLAGVVSSFLVALGLAMPVPPSPAYACSGPPLDPHEATAIVEGWVERVTLRPDLPSGITSARGGGDPFVPVELVLRVQRVLKGDPQGQVPVRLSAIDATSVYRDLAPGPDGRVWFTGSGGACGALDADVTGAYALLVLLRDGFGQLRIHSRAGAAFAGGSDASHAPAIEALRQRVAQGLRREE